MSQIVPHPRGRSEKVSTKAWMRPTHAPSDEELLRSDDPEDFGLFYDRHVRTLLAFFGRRTDDPEAAADLTAETFASALASRRRFRPGRTPAVAWLFGI